MFFYSKLHEDNFYTECYPDMAEMHDAIDDSDDEADYTKMDLVRGYLQQPLTSLLHVW